MREIDEARIFCCLAALPTVSFVAAHDAAVVGRSPRDRRNEGDEMAFQKILALCLMFAPTLLAEVDD